MKLITSRLYPRSLDDAIALLQNGHIKAGPMITHRVDLNDFPDLISRISSGEEKAIKIIVNVEE